MAPLVVLAVSGRGGDAGKLGPGPVLMDRKTNDHWIELSKTQ
jgi:hypothetical protein